MGAVFPSNEWLKRFEEKLNSDAQYAKIAKKWEGDLLFVIEPEGNLKEQMILYLDLWHGKCRSTAILDEIGERLGVCYYCQQIAEKFQDGVCQSCYDRDFAQ